MTTNTSNSLPYFYFYLKFPHLQLQQCSVDNRQVTVIYFLSPMLIDQFRYIKIQSRSIDISSRLVGINPTNAVVIPTSLVLMSIVLDWILIYRNWSIGSLTTTKKAEITFNLGPHTGRTLEISTSCWSRLKCWKQKNIWSYLNRRHFPDRQGTWDNHGLRPCHVTFTCQTAANFKNTTEKRRKSARHNSSILGQQQSISCAFCSSLTCHAKLRTTSVYALCDDWNHDFVTLTKSVQCT